MPLPQMLPGFLNVPVAGGRAGPVLPTPPVTPLCLLS